MENTRLTVVTRLMDRADDNLVTTSNLHLLGEVGDILIDTVGSAIVLDDSLTLRLVGDSDTLTTADNLRQDGVKIGNREADNLDGSTGSILHFGMVSDLQTKDVTCLDGILTVKLVGVISGAEQQHGIDVIVLLQVLDIGIAIKGFLLTTTDNSLILGSEDGIVLVLLMMNHRGLIDIEDTLLLTDTKLLVKLLFTGRKSLELFFGDNLLGIEAIDILVMGIPVVAKTRLALLDGIAVAGGITEGDILVGLEAVSIGMQSHHHGIERADGHVLTRCEVR